MTAIALTEQELEIERLREQKSLSFRAIGDQLGLSATAAGELYRQAKRKRRNAATAALAQQEDKSVFTLSLTAAECTALRSILDKACQPARPKSPAVLFTDTERAMAHLTRLKLDHVLLKKDSPS